MADAKRRTNPDLISQIESVQTCDRRCGVVKVLEQLTEEEGAALITALDNKSVSVSDLSRVLRHHGLSVSEKMLYRHRNRSAGGCGCPR